MTPRYLLGTAQRLMTPTATRPLYFSRPRVAPTSATSANATRGFSVVVTPDVRRRLAVKLFWIIYILYLSEGALRKWVFPEYADWLFFVRDPVVVAFYALCLGYRKCWPHFAWWLWTGFAVVSSLIGLFVYLASGYGLLEWVLGVRSYWLYMPMAFILPRLFNRESFERFLWWQLLLMPGYAGLVAFQYYSEPTAWINRGDLAEEGVALLTGERARTYGLFYYYSQNAFFVATQIVLVFVALRYFRVRGWLSVLFPVCVFALAVSAILTGARRMVFLAAVVMMAAVCGTVVSRDQRRWQLMVGVLLSGALGLGVIIWDADIVWEYQMRFEEAAMVEGSIWNRVLWEVGAFVDAMSVAPPFGFGVGAGTNAVVRLTGKPVFWLGENELERVVNELGPVLGMFYLILRWGIAVWLVSWAWRKARRGDAAAMPAAALSAVWLQNTWMTFSTAVGYQVWLLVGITFYLVLNGEEKVQATRSGGPWISRNYRLSSGFPSCTSST